MAQHKPFLILVVTLLASAVATAENIDPGNNDAQYAWTENAGWCNAESNGDGHDGVQVGDSELSGWMWAENVGWISLSCSNTLSCSTTDYGVLNDGNGVLSGYAWAENSGWINFSPSTSGVTVDPATGEFHGYAWGENIGWLSFNCDNTSSCGTVDYKVETGWVCDPPPAPPTGAPGLTAGVSGVEPTLEWDSGAITGATGFDIVRGSIGDLRAAGGDFSSSTDQCLDDNRTTSSLLISATPPAGESFWYLVRGQNCGGNGTYDTGEPSQAGLRDAEVAVSGADCL